jgi:pantoate--beta-alanine ligase
MADAQVDIAFAPEVEEIYPPGFSTFIDPPAVSLPLEGACRPNHFRGVATVVLKLFNLIQPDLSFFGQKDFQQCLVIRRMVADLNLPIDVRICPIVREPDGLALSSRNRYLAVSERHQALALCRSLSQAEQEIAAGERSAEAIRKAMREVLQGAGIQQIDYVSVAEPETLVEMERVSLPVVLLVAAFVGKTRLIDNRIVE